MRISATLRNRILSLDAAGVPAWQIAEETGLTIPQVTAITKK